MSLPSPCSLAVVVGLGHVVSAAASEQNSLILSKRYFCRFSSSPGGGNAFGRFTGGKVPAVRISTKRWSSSAGCFLAQTTPGSLGENLHSHKKGFYDYEFT